MGDGDAQRARAGSDIGQPRAAHARLAQVVERGVDEQLGFGARDEDIGGDAEFEAVELARAGDVGKRAALDSLAHGAEEAGEVLLGHRLGEGGVELRAVAPDRVAQQHFGLEAGVVDARLFEQLGGGEPDIAQVDDFVGVAHAPASASSRASSASAAASIRGSRLPSSRPARSWRVRPMRWSVTRFSGKL